MTILAIGSSVTTTPRDGGTIAIATNGGFGSVTVTPTGGSASTLNFGPEPVRRVFGPYAEGASVVISNQSCNSLDYDAGSGGYDPANVAITGGTAKFNDGAAAAPSVAFAAASGTGFYRRSAGQTVYSQAGADSVAFTAGGVVVTSSSIFGFSPAGDPTVVDAILARDAANALAQRNGTVAQTFNLYNTYTDASNYSLGAMSFNFPGRAGDFVIGTMGAGTGTASQVGLATAGVARWAVVTAGHMQPYSDNSYDMGASNGRVRTLYSVQINAATKAGAFVATDIAAGTFMVGRDTAGLTTKLYYNNAGTLQSVALA